MLGGIVMSTRSLPSCIAVILGISLAGSAAAELRIWTTSQTRHVLRSESPGDARDVRLFAARNEWRGFQILVRSDAAVQKLTVQPADLTGPDGAVIKADTARLYRQHQTEITRGTYRNDAFKADFYPDALIPFAHPVANKPLAGARFAAIPFDLPAEQTHGFWIDVYVPGDAKPGAYRGTYRVSGENQTAVDVPVELTVWNFALPQTPTLVTAFGSPAARLRSHYAAQAKAGKARMPEDFAAVEAQCAQLLAEHRMNATPPAELLRPVPAADGSFRIPDKNVVALRQFIDRYHVNAIQTPHPSSAVKDPAAQKDRLHAWLVAFDKMAAELKRPHVVFFTYLKDEPNTKEDYEYVQKWGRAVREAKSVVKVMVVEQTWTSDIKKKKI
jgi:hypothetical protein